MPLILRAEGARAVISRRAVTQLIPAPLSASEAPGAPATHCPSPGLRTGMGVTLGYFTTQLLTWGQVRQGGTKLKPGSG